MKLGFSSKPPKPSLSHIFSRRSQNQQYWISEFGALPTFEIGGLEKHLAEKYFDQSVSLPSLICPLNVET